MRTLADAARSSAAAPRPLNLLPSLLSDARHLLRGESPEYANKVYALQDDIWAIVEVCLHPR